MRIAFSAYRGTMQSGGLGLYLHALTRELALLGFEIDLYVGPPYPDPMPWLNMIRLPNEHYWGRRWGDRKLAPIDARAPMTKSDRRLPASHSAVTSNRELRPAGRKSRLKRNASNRIERRSFEVRARNNSGMGSSGM